jgi:methyl-accepting chemotaxis protein
MAIVAMWFQAAAGTAAPAGASLPAGSSSTLVSDQNLLLLFVGLVALAMVTQAIVMIGFAAKAGKAMHDMTEAVQDFKERVTPLIESATEISETTTSILRETAPKVRIIADNLLETSDVVRVSAQRFDSTIADVNIRAQQQVARIDTMVTAALATTVQIAETIQRGVEVPARKIAAVANQARSMFEGIRARVTRARAS